MAKKNNKSEESTFGLRGVGKMLAKHLARLNVYSPHDLLFHLPSRYQDRTEIQKINKLIPGQEAVIEAEIIEIAKPLRGRTKLLCILKDETGKLTLRFFHILSFQNDILKPGNKIRCYSAVRLSAAGLEMIHPEFQIIYAGKTIPIDAHLTPIYPATEGLSQYMLRKLTSNALEWMEEKIKYEELLPQTLLESLAFPTIKDAIKFIHRPPRETIMDDLLENKTLAQQRLAFEELLAHRISLLTMKENFKIQKSVPLKRSENLSQQFLHQLTFNLTNAQKRVTNEISEDLMRSYPMLRLVQGDVGSGKTVVAALSMLQIVENGFQAALMAPTELLAEQHYRTFNAWFEPLNIKVVFLSSNIKGRERSARLSAIKNGDAQVILGTHALFQEQVHFKNLALVVIDEQHRFGVLQRDMLRKKGMESDYYPHQLVMTATPIPRTLAMSFYADLDCSTIDELPEGRTPIRTSVIANSRRDEVIKRIRDVCKEGRQAYWVCPLIEESDALNCQSAIATAEQLQTILSELMVDLIHGRMTALQKESAMRLFQEGKTHLLVATTVIEVGVDVPNASLMIVENAERLGLSQLHQLRGRVGRGSVESFCVLLYQQPLSEIAKERLKVMRETTDGFQIAQRDLELRGPGEVLGTRQTGALTFRVANLMRDNHMLLKVHEAAEIIMREETHLIKPLFNRWIGEHKDFGKV